MENKNKIYKILTFICGVVVGIVIALLFASCGSDAAALAAFVPCSASLAGNISADCDNPRVKGYEQVGLIFNRADIDWTQVTYDASNPRIISAISLVQGKKPYVIYNQRNNPLPFDGTTTTYNTDTDQYDKTCQFYFEGIGGADSGNVVEPLKGGDFVILLQRKDHRGDGSFQFFGAQSGMKATAQVQDETTGYWLMTLTGSEPSAEVSFFATDYATTKAAFDTLLAQVE